MTKEIQQALLKDYYLRGHQYCCTNFSGCGYCEADVFTINKGRYISEFEVKISRADFKKDSKKVHKHGTLSGVIKNNQFHRSPNRFYYVCPENLIKLEEIPVYAGLIYYKDGLLIEIKTAPLLHKEKAPDEVIFKMCSVLSARAAIGGSLMAYTNKQNIKFYNSIT